MIKKITHKTIISISLALLLGVTIGALASYALPQNKSEQMQSFDAHRVLTETLANAELDDFIELESNIVPVMQKYGLRSGFLLIDQAEKENIISNDQCHALLHYVGHEAFAENPYDYEKITSIVEGTNCIGGFIHGVEAEIVAESGNVKQDLWDFCTYEKENGVNPGPCFHGVGHAASELYNNDIPKSLAMCDSLEGGSEPDLTNCYRGVFSQLGNSIIGVDGHTGLSVDRISVIGLDTKKPYAYCEKLETKYQSSCKSQLLKVLTQDVKFEDWLAVCLDPTFDYNSQEICTNINAGVYTRATLSFSDTTKLPDAINEFPEGLRKIAILGSLEAFSGYFTDGSQKDWKSFCASFKEIDDQKYCTDVFIAHTERNEAPWMERSDIR